MIICLTQLLIAESPTCFDALLFANLFAPCVVIFDRPADSSLSNKPTKLMKYGARLVSKLVEKSPKCDFSYAARAQFALNDTFDAAVPADYRLSIGALERPEGFLMLGQSLQCLMKFMALR